jgi:hypothetical protein
LQGRIWSSSQLSESQLKGMRHYFNWSRLQHDCACPFSSCFVSK